MKLRKRAPRAPGTTTVARPRREFTYTYRGFRFEVAPLALEFKILGDVSVHVRLSHAERMSTPHRLTPCGYGVDVGATCEAAERKLDALLDFWERDGEHQAASRRKIAAFAERDGRFQA